MRDSALVIFDAGQTDVAQSLSTCARSFSATTFRQYRPPCWFASASMRYMEVGGNCLSRRHGRFCNLTIYAAANPWLRKRSMTRPLIIIDDAGLWLREVGELMRWSEIQSVECGRRIQPRCTIVWRHEPIRIVAKGNFMDRDGKCLLASSVYSVVKELWEQNRTGSQA